jgi:hypothetical protein
MAITDGGAQYVRLGPYWDSSNSTIFTGIIVYAYEPGTTTPKTIWSDEAKTTAITDSKVTAGADGLVQFYADGAYRILVLQSDDSTTIEDNDDFKITADTSTMWEGNQGTSYPSVGPNNDYQLAVLHEAGGNIVTLGASDGTSFRDLARVVGIGANVASASELTITAGTGDYFVVTGTTDVDTIASIGVGAVVTFNFAGVLNLIHSASLVLPNATNITTSANESFTFRETATGIWALEGTSKASSIISSSNTWTGTQDFTGATVTVAKSSVAAEVVNNDRLDEYHEVHVDAAQVGSLAYTTGIQVVPLTETLDPGSNFASNTFTAPIAGDYEIDFVCSSAWNTNATNSTFTIALRKNSVNVRTVSFYESHSDGGNVEPQIYIPYIVTLAASDTIDFTFTHSGAANPARTLNNAFLKISLRKEA